MLAARVSDMHVCPMVTPGTPPIPHVGGPIIPPCAVTVLTGGLFQARMGDMCICVGPPDVIAMGSPNVMAMGSLAARLGDPTVHGGTIVAGMPTVLIGSGGAGGGGAGAAKAVGASAGQSMDTSILAAAAATIAPGQQAATYKNAAKTGKPFCERCQG